MANISGEADFSLEAFVVAGVINNPAITATGDLVLGAIELDGVGQFDTDADITGTVDFELAAFVVEGEAKIVDNFATGSLVLGGIELYTKAQGPGTLVTFLGSARIGNTIIVVFQGLPDRSIAWNLTGGSGTLNPMSLATDANGIAYCRFTPTSEGAAEISVTYAR